ncbi:hypothetical protein MUP32_05040, partial [Candidatus Microgenomates bacterium]|nr:hypothetical protein [Candidatus Microgenomates bacterium]
LSDLILVLVILLPKGSVFAQDTFGPICDTTIPGVTCAPTSTPASQPTSTTYPTSTPRPTATPQPPVSGNMENSLLLLGISGVLTLGGLTSFATLRHSGKK